MSRERGVLIVPGGACLAPTGVCHQGDPMHNVLDVRRRLCASEDMVHWEHVGSARWTFSLMVAAMLFATRAVAQLAPVGDEFEVTTQTAISQNHPAISASADGFVIVWSNGAVDTPSPDGDNAGVSGQRHASDGSRVGSEFQINTYTTGAQRFPAVGASADGDFVVVWQGPGTGGTGVHGQRFDASAGEQGNEFLVSADAFAPPQVARNDDDSFVVAWWGPNDGGSPGFSGPFGIFARRYDSGGEPIGDAFQVNTYTTNQQRNPAIASTTDGAFVIAWQSEQDPGDENDDDGIFAQRYTSAGVASGTEFEVNTYTPGFQINPAVATDSSGNFVVAWQSKDDESSYGIFAQRFSSGGTPLGTEFQVNTYTQFDQSQPDLDFDENGQFVVTWASQGQDGEGRGVFAQFFDETGDPSGTEFQVNTTTPGDQDLPAVSAIGAGAFVITWDSGADGVFAQRFEAATPTTSPGAPSPTPTATPTEVNGGECAGDCDGSNVVQVNELIRCVNIALETAEVSACMPCDLDGNGRVLINELVTAVNALLRSCPE